MTRPTPLDIWITCEGASRSVLFNSGDGGRTWTQHTSDDALNLELSAAGGAEAWATTNTPHPANDTYSTLWHTTDGGATWTQVWVTLPRRASAAQIDCLAVPSGPYHEPRDDCE